jgi:hypothetical protein
MAIGQRYQAGHSGWVAERWNGSSWAIVYRTSPRRSMLAVSCPSASWCLIAGGGTDPARASGTWTAVWTPHVVTVAQPAALRWTSTYSLDCVRPADCVLAGANIKPYSRGGLSVERLVFTRQADRVRWSAMPYAHQPSYAVPYSVSCPSAASCVMAGLGEYPDPVFAAQWNGTTWTTMTTADVTLPKCPPMGPPCASPPQFKSVSCSSGSACLAIGPRSNWGVATLVEWWDGSTWTIEPAPPGRVRLTSVSCAVDGVCLVVGYKLSHVFEPAAFQWSSGHWRDVSPHARPSLTLGAQFADVDCSGSSDCVAAGSYVAYPITGPNSFSLWGHWNGAQWERLSG